MNTANRQGNLHSRSSYRHAHDISNLCPDSKYFFLSWIRMQVKASCNNVLAVLYEAYVVTFPCIKQDASSPPPLDNLI